MIDLGDQVTLTYPSKPASPATVTVTISLPDGTTTSPTAALSGTYTYTPTQAGRHTVLWVATGPADAYSDTFDVASPTSATIISLDDAKTHLKITSTANDEDLRLYLSAVTTVIEDVVGRVTPITFTEIVEAADMIVLRRAPVASVTSVAAFDPIYGYPLPTYQLDGPNGTLHHVPNPMWGYNDYYLYATQLYGRRLTVTYTAGRSVIPAAMQIAARMILNDLWAARRGAMAMPARGGDEEQIVTGYAMNDRVLELLAPFTNTAGVG